MEVWRRRNTRYVPRNFVYLRDLAGIQDRVGCAGEGCSDIECDDDGFFVAGVGFSRCPRLLHGGRGWGSERKIPKERETDSEGRASFTIRCNEADPDRRWAQRCPEVISIKTSL